MAKFKPTLLNNRSGCLFYYCALLLALTLPGQYLYAQDCDRCTEVTIELFLEGPFNGAGMNVTLNDYHLLPGQDINLSSNPGVPLLGQATAVGQPYHRPPWNHPGVEGDRYGDPATNSHPDLISYDEDVVDWVLVTVRRGNASVGNNIWRCAGLLYQNGQVEFPEECSCLITSTQENYHIIVEHRNHLSAMSAEIMPVGDQLYYSFIETDSWIFQDALGNPVGVGQNQIGPFFVMFSANGEQINSRNHINGNDQTLWLQENGMIFRYLDGDFDMNADVNSIDNALWIRNNGLFNLIPF